MGQLIRQSEMSLKSSKEEWTQLARGVHRIKAQCREFREVIKVVVHEN